MSRLRTATAAGAAALLLAGCGVDTEEAGRAAVSATTAAPTQSTGPDGAVTATPARRPVALPQRPAGTVALAAQVNALSDSVVAGFEASSDVEVAGTRIGEGRSYAELCSGRADVVQTSIPPTAADYQACSARGLEIAEPVQIGSDAVVLATKNQSDVGGDCVSVRQARDLFRSGSPYTNWNQLGFDDLPIRTTGREDGSNSFEFFGLEVLGLADATLGDVRSDFVVRPTDARERTEVTNDAGLAQARRRAAVYAREQRAATAGERRRAVARAVRAADRRVNAEIRRVNERNARLNRTVDAARLIRDNRRRSFVAKRDATRRANVPFDARVAKRTAAFLATALREAARSGAVGPFSFNYYELFESRLRPLEIDFGTPETRSGMPVRFSDLARADQTRLAPAIRAQLARESGATAAGTTGASGAAASIDPDTPIPRVAGLPKRTQRGEEIFAGPNCVFPSQVTITTGSYPLTRRIFYVTTKQGLRRPEVRGLLTFTLDEVQRLARAARLVAITDQQRRAAYVTVTGAPPVDQGTTGASGATGTTGSTGGGGTTGTSGPGGSPSGASGASGPVIPGVAPG